MDTYGTVSDEQKEFSAITVMRCMLTAYAEDNKISFEQALLDFSKSRSYQMLFDYETEVWKEGPEYLRYLYESEIKENKSNAGF